MTRPCRLPVGATRTGLCPACGGETLMRRTATGWACPDCAHEYAGRFRAPIRQRRTIDVRRAIALCEAGHSYHAAAKLLGCHASMLKRAMARSGYTPRLHKPTNPGRGSTRSVVVPAHLVDAYPALNVAEIAERAGVSYATAYRRVREARGGELAPRVVWAQRAHVRARSAESDARCVEAIRMRDAGAKWLEVALALGYSSEYHANSAVRRYRARSGAAS